MSYYSHCKKYAHAAAVAAVAAAAGGVLQVAGRHLASGSYNCSSSCGVWQIAAEKEIYKQTVAVTQRRGRQNNRAIDLWPPMIDWSMAALIARQLYGTNRGGKKGIQLSSRLARFVSQKSCQALATVAPRQCAGKRDETKWNKAESEMKRNNNNNKNEINFYIFAPCAIKTEVRQQKPAPELYNENQPKADFQRETTTTAATTQQQPKRNPWIISTEISTTTTTAKRTTIGGQKRHKACWNLIMNKSEKASLLAVTLTCDCNSHCNCDCHSDYSSDCHSDCKR